jgi:FixJ family two-component response regulator
MIALAAMVFVIDDDAPVRKSLKRLLDAADYQVELFESAADFLARPPFQGPSCVIVDVRMPGLSGIDLQKTLVQRRRQEQLVFLTGHGDIPICVQAMKAGAIEFLTKPVNEQDLLRAIQEAIERDRHTREEHEERRDLRRRYESLTAREQEVMVQVISGRLNKQIAAEMSITDDTVKFHRGHIMRKMRADSLADLVRMAQNLGISHRRSA